MPIRRQWLRRKEPAGRSWTVKRLRIVLTNVNPEKPVGKLPSYTTTGRKFLRSAGIARYFKKICAATNNPQQHQAGL